MDLIIKIQKWTGYNEDVASFDCTLCRFRLLPNLDKAYIITAAEGHTRTAHAIEEDIKIVEVKG